jgi:hypothetical protein
MGDRAPYRSKSAISGKLHPTSQDIEGDAQHVSRNPHLAII